MNPNHMQQAIEARKSTRTFQKEPLSPVDIDVPDGIYYITTWHRDL